MSHWDCRRQFNIGVDWLNLGHEISRVGDRKAYDAAGDKVGAHIGCQGGHQFGIRGAKQRNCLIGAWAKYSLSSC